MSFLVWIFFCLASFVVNSVSPPLNFLTIGKFAEGARPSSTMERNILWSITTPYFLKSSYILRRPQNFAKSSPYFWLHYIQSKVRGRFRKVLWPSQNIWTLIWRKTLTGQAVFLELTLLASVTHKKNPYLVNVAFAVGRLFTKLCPVKLTSKAFKMFVFYYLHGFYLCLSVDDQICTRTCT